MDAVSALAQIRGPAPLHEDTILRLVRVPKGSLKLELVAVVFKET